MTHNELIRRLERAGCTLLRHGTRHDIWYSPITGKKATVPRHGRKDVPLGTLKSIEKELLGLKARELFCPENQHVDMI